MEQRATKLYILTTFSSFEYGTFLMRLVRVRARRRRCSSQRHPYPNHEQTFVRYYVSLTWQTSHVPQKGSCVCKAYV